MDLSSLISKIFLSQSQLVFRADFGCDSKSAAKILAEVSKACPHLVSFLAIHV